MVEPVGSHISSAARLLGRTVQPAAPVTAIAPAGRPATGADDMRVAATGLARELSQSAPVDHERVAEIRHAIASGTYPLAPDSVADRLLALRLDWKPGDA